MVSGEGFLGLRPRFLFGCSIEMEIIKVLWLWKWFLGFSRNRTLSLSKREGRREGKGGLFRYLK